MSYVPASQVQPKPVEWLWPWRLGLGKLALLEGDPELGKTWVTCDLCARLSVGQLFPDGQRSPGPATSIILSDEDGSADTLRPRLELLGADLDRVIIPDTKVDKRPLTMPSQSARLKRLVADHHARLVVIDPWISFLDPGVFVSSDASVRRALRPLARLAERCRCAILLIRHLRKLLGNCALYRGAGSIGLIAMCRSAWLLARSPLDDVNVFAQVKNNLGPKQPSLAYEFSGRPAVGSGQEAEGPATTSLPTADCQLPTLPFRWLGPTFWTADELAGRQLTRAGRLAQARAFLNELLHQSPRPIREVVALASEQEIAKRTVQRAAKELKLQVRRVIFAGRHPRNYWLLPGQKLPAVIPEECVAPAWM